MSSSNCCFLTCIQISQEAGQVVCYSHLFQNFPQFIVIHTVKGFDIVNKAEIDVFLELSCFFHDPADAGNLICGSSAFSKTSLTIKVRGSSRECQTATAQEQRRGATRRPRSGGPAERSYPASEGQGRQPGGPTPRPRPRPRPGAAARRTNPRPRSRGCAGAGGRRGAIPS